MIQRLIKNLFFILIAITFLGLFVVLFSIGLVALWYLLIIGLIIWAIRHIYYFFKGEKPPSIVEQYSYYSSSKTENNKKKRGRVIDYDEFKDK
jgi:1,4-dihydroxy-2-naphthoate octaprenyltransferase